MLKLLVLTILFVNLDLVYGPFSLMKSGKFTTLKKMTPNLTKLLHNRKSVPSEAISASLSPSQVAMPKKDLTKGLSRSVNYRALPIEIIKGEYYLPKVLDDYLESTETFSKKSKKSKKSEKGSPRVEFFCPNNNPDEDSCMLPTNQRQCATKPKPVIKPILKPCDNDESSQQPDSADDDVSQNVHDENGNTQPGDTADVPQNIGENGEMCSVTCGPRGRSEMYIFAYQDKKFEIEEYVIYSFCYNHEKKETIYAHHEMHWPKSLSNKKLKPEQKMSFEMNTEDYGYFEGFFKTVKNAYENSKVYQAQKLVPPEDFPLAFWKIPTFHYVNVRPQHKDLVKLWDLISELIRNGLYARYNYKHSIYTGAFRLTTGIDDIEYLGDKQIEIPKFWVKVILLEDDENVTRGLAILMHNNTEQDTTIHWERYCDKNYCFIHDLRNKIFKDFTNPGFKVRCCSISENILTLFDLQAEYKNKKIQNLLVEDLIDSRFIIKNPELQYEQNEINTNPLEQLDLPAN